MNPLGHSLGREVSIREYDVLVKDTVSPTEATQPIPREDWDWLHEGCLNIS